MRIFWQRCRGSATTPISPIAEMIRRDMETGEAHGLTTFGSRISHPRLKSSFVRLNRKKQMTVYIAGLYKVHRRPAEPDVTRQICRMTGNLTGLGNETLWIHGVASGKWGILFPGDCLDHFPEWCRLAKVGVPARSASDGAEMSAVP